MKIENLMKACDSFEVFQGELRKAHSDAVNSGDQFAEIAIFSLIELASELRPRLARVKDAAIETKSNK